MKAKKITITKDELNSGSYLDTDTAYTDTYGNVYYPKNIRYDNSSTGSISVGYIYIGPNESADVAAVPAFYDYLPIATNTSNENLGACKTVRIKLLSGTATGSLVFYIYNYVSYSTN
jgi:hypothetical protein